MLILNRRGEKDDYVEVVLLIITKDTEYNPNPSTHLQYEPNLFCDTNISSNHSHPKAAKRFIPRAIWAHIAPLHSLNCSTVIAAVAEFLAYNIFSNKREKSSINVASKSRTRE